MIALIIISFILILIAGIFLLPVSLVANTETKQYYLSMPLYFKVSFPLIENISEGIHIKIFFFKRKINPFKESGKGIKKTNRTKKNKVKKPTLLIKNILRKFKVKKLDADIDTGNFPLNAQLVPVTIVLNRGKANIRINFENRNYLNIHIITHVGAIIATYIIHNIKHTKNRNHGNKF